ncbi:hypothetical protein C2I17_22675 [Niallia circulans]|nr:hypothetical protein C2I17_22675 [Niallia circulans]
MIVDKKGSECFHSGPLLSFRVCFFHYYTEFFAIKQNKLALSYRLMRIRGRSSVAFLFLSGNEWKYIRWIIFIHFIKYLSYNESVMLDWLGKAIFG